MAIGVTYVNPPPWMEAQQRNLLDASKALTRQAPVGGLPQQGIVGFRPLQTGAIRGTAGLYGIDPTTGLPTGTGAAFDPAFAQAQQDIGTGMSTVGMGIPSLQAAQGQFDPSTSNYQQFFNQYQSDVTKEALKQMDAEAAVARNQLQDQAQQVGAFGGSRMGVQEAELDKNILDIKSRRIFQDLAQNYQQAQDKAIGTYESAAGRRLQAAPLFGQIGTGQAGLGAQRAGMATQQFGMQQQGLGSLFGFGQAEQTQAQQLANEQFRQQIEMSQEPYKRLGFMSDILQGIPSYQQTVQQKPLPYTNPLLGALGAGLGTYGILSGAEGAGSAFGLGSSV
jgi:hypothetical protein|tara:strand:- start:3577 stop:4584 length:1008 start_codon:yes stop_codon:yes gene_type:complete